MNHKMAHNIEVGGGQCSLQNYLQIKELKFVASIHSCETSKLVVLERAMVQHQSSV